MRHALKWLQARWRALMSSRPRTWQDWVWPMPIMVYGEGKTASAFHPQISSPFGYGVRGGGTRDHLGSDLCYKRNKPGAVKLPQQTRRYFCYDNIPMFASGAGKVTFAAYTTQGWTCVIDHPMSPLGRIKTYTTHMASLFVKKGDTVQAGQRIGTVGDSPKGKDVRHAHYEVWVLSRGSKRSERAVDPAGMLPWFGAVVWHNGAPVGRREATNREWTPSPGSMGVHSRVTLGAATLGAGFEALNIGSVAIG